MSETINWMFKVQVSGGPTVTATDKLSLKTYVKSSVTVKNGTPLDVAFVVAPSLLVVTASKYVDDKHGVTYIVNGAGGPNTLDGPLVLIGKENVKLLDKALEKLTFTNPFQEDISIELMSAKDI